MRGGPCENERRTKKIEKNGKKELTKGKGCGNLTKLSGRAAERQGFEETERKASEKNT